MKTDGNSVSEEQYHIAIKMICSISANTRRATVAAFWCAMPCYRLTRLNGAVLCQYYGVLLACHVFHFYCMRVVCAEYTVLCSTYNVKCGNQLIL